MTIILTGLSRSFRTHPKLFTFDAKYKDSIEKLMTFMPQPLWLTELIKKSYPSRFLLAKLTRAPVIGSIIDQLFFENDNIIYLPQDRVVQLNMTIDKPEDTVLPSIVLEHFINEAKHHWIMNWCICRASTKCKDYPVNLGCLFMGEASTRIDPRLGRRATREEALEHVKRCQEAGLVHLIGRNKLDSVWLGVSPGKRLLTVCNCCPCCCLWKILPDLDPQISSKITKMPGVELSVNDRCVGCGTCTQGVCFVKAIELINGKSVVTDKCRGCGRCVNVCPHGAREISINKELYVKKSIERISSSIELS